MNRYSLEGLIFLTFGIAVVIWTVAKWHNNSSIPRLRLISAFLIIFYGIFALKQFPLNFNQINNFSFKSLFEEENKQMSGASLLLLGTFFLIWSIRTREKSDMVTNVQTITGAVSAILLG